MNRTWKTNVLLSYNDNVDSAQQHALAPSYTWWVNNGYKYNDDDDEFCVSMSFCNQRKKTDTVKELKETKQKKNYPGAAKEKRKQSKLGIANVLPIRTTTTTKKKPKWKNQKNNNNKILAKQRRKNEQNETTKQGNENVFHFERWNVSLKRESNIHEQQQPTTWITAANKWFVHKIDSPVGRT